jgi:hypothetical protein
MRIYLNLGLPRTGGLRYSVGVSRHCTPRGNGPGRTDAAGNVQPDVPPWNRLGYGAIEVIYVDRR